MAEVTTEVARKDLTLDVCPRCSAIWFDPMEIQLVPRKVHPKKKKPQMSPQAREKAALFELESKKRQQRWDMSDSMMPDQAWHWIPGILGLPVELDAPKVSRMPLVTWGTMAACIVTTIWILANYVPGISTVFDDWGFVAAQWNRDGGLTMLTSFFIHGGIFHLLGNMYFLFVFGDNVEDRLGRWSFVCLLIFSHLCGMLAQGVLGPNPNISCVGASAGISGVIAYYAVAFPKVRLGIMFRYFFFFRWIRMSAAVALVLYLLMQLFGAYMQINGFGGVSYLGHLGGLVVGLTAAITHKVLAKRQTAKTIRG
jgi:membrane associated rhomboid family serine protease